MSYQIKELKPELAEDFLDFMGNTDFSSESHWNHCYCRFYHSDTSWEDWRERSSEENRQEAYNAIKSGQMKGYLLYDGEKPIGWCNANDLKEFKRIKKEAEDRLDLSKKIGSIICFVIHPDYRKQGLSKKLMRRAVSDFQAMDYDLIMALPVEFDKPEMRYRGTVSMYQEVGFQEIAREDKLSVMLYEI